MSVEVMEQYFPDEEFYMTPEQMEKNAEDPRYQVYLKLLPQDRYEQGKQIILCTPVEYLEDVFQDILSYINIYDVWGGEETESDDEYDLYNSGIPTIEDMNDFEINLEQTTLKNEIEDLENMIENKYTNYPNDVIPIKEARELARQYNEVEYTQTEKAGQLTRKTNYDINYYTIVIISKYVKKEKLTVEYLVEFLDKFHEYKILDSTLF